MNGRHVSLWSAALLLLVILGGCAGTGTENTDLKTRIRELETALQKTENERDMLQQDVDKYIASLKEAESKLADAVDDRNGLQVQVRNLTSTVSDQTAARQRLQAQVEELSSSRDQLQLQVTDLTVSRDEFSQMVETLTQTRGLLETKVASLESARAAALQDAADAHAKIAQLNTKLRAQTEQMSELQTQVVSIRSVLEQLQQKLQ